jgi:hypothetical protein
VREFCKDKDWSHIISHKNGGSNQASNGIFEHFRINRSRGSNNMTAKELSAARNVIYQATFQSTVIQVTSAMTKATLIAVTVELVFAILENALLYTDGQITESEFITKVQDSTLQAGITAAVVTALLVLISLVFPPVAVLLSSVAVPLTIAGIGSMSFRAWDILSQTIKVFIAKSAKWEEAQEINSDEPEINLALAVAYYLQGEAEKAIIAMPKIKFFER